MTNFKSPIKKVRQDGIAQETNMFFPIGQRTETWNWQTQTFSRVGNIVYGHIGYCCVSVGFFESFLYI